MFIFTFAFVLLATLSNTVSSSPTASDHETENPPEDLHATLSQLNSTHCHLELTNSGSTDVKLLKWNSLFDQNTESHSFTILNPATKKSLVPGPYMIRKIYDKNILPNHVLTLPAKRSWTGTYDLTQLFDIPTAGIYQVAFTGALTVLSESHALKDSHHTIAACPLVTMRLSKSAPSATTLEARSLFGGPKWVPAGSDRDRSTTCDNAQKWVIGRALKQAVVMAADARDAVPMAGHPKGNGELYRSWFNDNSQAFVTAAFDKMS